MSQAELKKQLKNSYETVPQVISNIEWLEQFFYQNKNLRGVFATAYLHITRSLNEAFDTDTFQKKSWTKSYLIRFANLYREALLNDLLGKDENVPKAWRISFDLADKKEGLIIQHLLLGINAHINHDLAIALHDVQIDPYRDQKYSDHTQVNNILEKATDGLKKAVAEKYAPILDSLDRAFGSIDDEITEFSIPKAREHAWSMAVALSAADSDLEREILQNSLDEQAAVLSSLILSSPTRDPRFIGFVNVLKWIDRKLKSFIDIIKF